MLAAWFGFVLGFWRFAFETGDSFSENIGPVLLSKVISLCFWQAGLDESGNDLIPYFLSFFAFGQVQVTHQFGHALEAHGFFVVVKPLDDSLLVAGVVFHAHVANPQKFGQPAEVARSEA